ncbi:hypothetical protein GOV07_02540 [Candidatus Woesearchaeota archaeon]|nr:hypothetical protein [Candidatus Woesearchaeota archaeon]
MERTNRKGRTAAMIFLIILASVLIFNALFSFSYSVGPNYRNISVDTRVNITQSKPEVLFVNIEDPVTLNAGGLHTVWCNATVRDWNGWADITNVTAFFWDNGTVAQSDPDDNNDHYTNTSCTSTGNDGNFTAYYTCNFTLWYYANAGSNWICNVTAKDAYLFNASVGQSNWLLNTTTVSQLLALNISTQLIDYGDMAVGDTSVTSEEANITNYGNQDINISVKGYGATDGDGLAFVCSVGNIAVGNERFSLNATGDYLVDYDSLTSNFQQIPLLTLPQETIDGTQIVNSTYWKIYIPPNPFGVCNGTVVFQAEAS